MDRYQVYSLDVWGGEEEGDWDINNWFKEGIIELLGSSEDEDFIKRLVEEGFLKTHDEEGNSVFDCVYVEDFGNGWVYIERKSDGYPIYHLEFIEED